MPHRTLAHSCRRWRLPSLSARRRRIEPSTSTTGRTTSTSRSSRSSPRRPASRSSTTSIDSNEILETKLLAGGTGYDVVVPTAEFLARQIKAGVFQKLDKSKLPNLTNMPGTSSTSALATYDPGNEYSVNYMWGTTGIGYNVDEDQGSARRSPRRQLGRGLQAGERRRSSKDCGVYVLDAPDGDHPAALNYLGLDPELKDPRGPRQGRANAARKRSARTSSKFHSSEYINALANGDICLAVGWSGDVFQARDRADEAEQGVDGRLRHPEGRRADVVRPDGDPGGCPARRRGARLHQLHA